MAISPPSDILLDVAAAADPAKVQAATARLAVLAADPSAANDGFSNALASAGTSSAPGLPGGAARLNTSMGGTHAAAAHGKQSVYTKFEAVLLQSFIEAMLPKDEELFGDKNSAGVYRSMMAEQLANQIAAAGGIGIAKSIESAHPGGGSQNAHDKSSA